MLGGFPDAPVRNGGADEVREEICGSRRNDGEIVGRLKTGDVRYEGLRLV